MLSETAQASNFAEERDPVNCFPVDLIPLGKDMGNMRFFAVYLFIGAPIIFNNMLRRQGGIVFIVG